MNNKNTDIDGLLQNIASRVHSPRGSKAPSDQHFQRLVDGLDDAPVEQKGSPVRRLFFNRWAVAASILVVSCIGWAMVTFYVVGSGSWMSSSPADKSSVAVAPVEFSNVPLAEVFAYVESAYNVSISCSDSEISSFRVTIVLTPGESLDTVMDVLADIGGFDYEIDADKTNVSVW